MTPSHLLLTKGDFKGNQGFYGRRKAIRGGEGVITDKVEGGSRVRIKGGGGSGEGLGVGEAGVAGKERSLGVPCEGKVAGCDCWVDRNKMALETASRDLVGEGGNTNRDSNSSPCVVENGYGRAFGLQPSSSTN
ncbi:hypothetical protein NL676_010909 [Syzygium grande]|nr:hypothetical protein NL676_010909 [Syzygium grande]